MSPTPDTPKRKPLSVSALLALAGACCALSVVAIPAPQPSPGGFANAVDPTDPGVDPTTLPSLRHVASTLSNGLGEVASTLVNRTHR